jgi:hypothetical protein
LAVGAEMPSTPSIQRRLRRGDASLNRGQQRGDLLHLRAKRRPVGIVEIEAGERLRK